MSFGGGKNTKVNKLFNSLVNMKIFRGSQCNSLERVSSPSVSADQNAQDLQKRTTASPVPYAYGGSVIYKPYVYRIIYPIRLMVDIYYGCFTSVQKTILENAVAGLCNSSWWGNF